MVDINPFPTFQDLEHSNSSAYTPLPDHSTQKDARPVNPRRPLKLLLSIFSGFLLVSLLVILVAHQTPKDQTHIIDEKPSLSSSRGFKEGVSEKAFRLDSGDEESFEWTNTKLSRQRSAYHFQPQENWMSDPDGPLFYKGWYHFFYQYNPYAAVWGNISWGHAVSKDLINWLYLPLAMVPAYWYEHSGVLSGSATLLPDGNIVMLYTGLTKESVQVQNVAFPANLSDPLLLDWVRYSGNPVLFPPPGIGDMDFRDPTTAWNVEDKWYISIGSKVGTTGIALMYETTDFLNFTLLDGLLHYVNTTGVWECVDFYPISTTADNGLDTSVNGPGVKHVLKASVEDINHDYYALGTYNVESNTWIPDDPELDVGKGIRYDYGKYYASKTFYDQNKARRLLWGWIGETDGQKADLPKDWAGLQNIPRVVSFDIKTKSNLLLWPIEEVESLRLGIKEFENVEIKAGAVVPLDIGTATNLDITAEFEIDSHAMERTIETHVLYNCDTSGGAAERGILGPFGLLVLADESLIEQTAVYFYIAKATDGALKTYFCSDESRSSIASDIGKKVYGSVVPVLGGEKFSVRILVDHSIIEAFAQGGRTCITSRVYPTKAIHGAARLFLFNNATGVDVTLASLKIWEMNSAFFHPYPL